MQEVEWALVRKCSAEDIENISSIFDNMVRSMGSCLEKVCGDLSWEKESGKKECDWSLDFHLVD